MFPFLWQIIAPTYIQRDRTFLYESQFGLKCIFLQYLCTLCNRLMHTPKVGWTYLSLWQNSTLPSHHIFFNFLIFLVNKVSDFDHYCLTSFMVQWLRLLAVDWLIVGSNSSLVMFFSYFFSKGIKNWIKIWWEGRVEFCQRLR